MQVKRVLKWTLLFVLTMTVIAGVTLFTVDLGFLRPTIEKRVSSYTGRAFTMGPGLSIRLGKELVIEAENVRLANAAWAGPEDLAQIEKARLVIETRSLWSGPLVLKMVQTEGVRLRLVQNEEGQSNWVMGDAAVAQSAPETSLPFLLETLGLKNGRIELRTPLLDQPLVAEISELTESVGASGMIESRLSGSLNGKPVAFSGTAGPYERLLSGDDFELSGSGLFGNIQLDGKAVFDNLYLPHRPAIEVRLEGPELEELTAMLGIDGLGRGPISLLATTTVQDGGLSARIKGSLGEFKVDLSSNAESLQSFGDAQVEARVSGPNFGRIARLAAQDGWPEKPFDLSANIQRSGAVLQISQLDMMLAGAKLDLQGQLPAFPDLAGANISLNAKGPDLAPFRQGLGFADLPAGAFSISGDISSPAGSATRVALKYTTPLARGEISGAIGGGADLVGTNLQIRAQGDDATLVGKMLELPGMSRSPWTLALDVRVENSAYYSISSMAFNAQDFSFSLKGRVGSADTTANTAVDFSVSGSRLSDFQGVVGDSAALPAEPFSLGGQVESVPLGWKLADVRGKSGTTNLTLNGVLGSGQQLDGTDLAISASGSGLERFLGPDSVVKLPAGPFQLQTGLAASAGQLKLSKLDFGAGPLKVKGDVQLAWPPAMEGVHFTLDIGGEDISRILPRLGGLELDPQTYSAQLKGAFQSERFNLEQGRINIGQNRLNLEGSVSPPPDLSSTRLKLVFESPDLSKLGTYNGVRWKSVPFSINSSFTGAGSRLDMNPFEAQLGAGKVTGSFGMDFGPEVPVFSLQLSAGELDLKPFLAEMPAQPEKSKEELKTARLIPELDIPLETLAAFDGSFGLSIGSILLRESRLSGVRVNGSLKNGSLAISEMGADGYKGRLVMTLDLVPVEGGKARVASSIKSSGFVPASALLSAEEQELSPAFDTAIRLQGNGATLREVAATLNGDVTISSAGGQLRNRKQTNKRRAMLAEIVSAISPDASRQSVVNISCLAVVVKAAEGRLKLDPGIAVQSDKLNIFAKGNIDLGSEKVDINFSTQTRKSVDVSASELFSPYVKLSGTLANTSVALDPKGTLLSGGAAYLSGGLSILAKKALDTISSDNPCEGHLSEAAPGSQP